MLETRESFGDILWHCEVNGFVWVIPFEVDAAENFTVFVNGDVIMFLERGDEMSGVRVADKLDAEIVNNEVEDGGSGCMTKEAGCVAGWVVAVIS